MAHQQEFIEMGNFFCKLHLLVNFASETDKILKELESLMILEGHENKYAYNSN